MWAECIVLKYTLTIYQFFFSNSLNGPKLTYAYTQSGWQFAFAELSPNCCPMRFSRPSKILVSFQIPSTGPSYLPSQPLFHFVPHNQAGLASYAQLGLLPLKLSPNLFPHAYWTLTLMMIKKQQQQGRDKHSHFIRSNDSAWWIILSIEKLV